MSKNKLIGAVSLVALLTVFVVGQAHSAEVTKMSVDLVPVQYISVNGDAAKFREQYWMTDGYSGGVADLSITSQLNKTTNFDLSSYGFPSANDYGAVIDLEKENLGFVHFDYKTFRKYYENKGGTYYPFSTLETSKLDEDLNMDIGNLGLEIGHALPGLPEMSLFYNQKTKDGKKSRLSWGYATESSVRRKTVPSWQDVQETTNSLGLRAKTDFMGVNLSGEQKWDFIRSHLFRVETNLSTNSTASEKTIVRQDQEPESDVMTTVLKADKWLWDEKGHMSLGFRRNKIDNNQGEFLRTYDQYGVPTGTKNIFNATSDNKLESNAAAGNFTAQLAKNLNLQTKVKAETIGRRGGSTYPNDSTSPPNSIPNTTEVSQVENKVWRWGENLGLRYTGIKRTALYTEAEFQQTKNWIEENRDSIAGESASSSGEVFTRETRVNSNKYVLTAGVRSALSKLVTLTAQARRKVEINDYDDTRESASSGSSDKSAFFDYLQVRGNEFTTKWTCKPINKVTGSIRYQYADNDYVPRTENSVNQVAQTLSHNFTYDLILEPTDRLLVDLAYGRQRIRTVSPADHATSARTPAFTSNVDTIMISGNYILTEKLSVNSTFNKSTQHNFDDYTASGLPYGVNAQWYDASVGIKWAYNKNWSLEPRYSFYSYASNDNTAASDYRAHGLWLAVDYDWF